MINTKKALLLSLSLLLSSYNTFAEEVVEHVSTTNNIVNVNTNTNVSSVNNAVQKTENTVNEVKPKIATLVEEVKAKEAQVINNKEQSYNKVNYANALKGVSIKIGTAAYPPFVIVDNKNYGVPTGIEIDILKEMQKRLGFNLANNSYNFASFSEVMDLGQSGDVDIMSGGISLTPERRNTYDVSPSFYQSSMALVTRHDLINSIKSFSDINGKILAAETGTDPTVWISDPNIKVHLKEYMTTFIAFYAVSKAEADIAIMDYPAAVYYSNRWPSGKLVVVDSIDDPDAKICFTYKKGFKYAKYFNAALEDMIRDGTVKNIVNKYLE